MNRALAIARVALIETLRSPTALLAALGLFWLVPLLTFIGGQDEGTRVWLSRVLPAEGLRLLLPLTAALGGAWMLNVALRRGWATLPARRAEWFAGAALAGLVLLALAAGLLCAGAAAAASMLGESALAARTSTAESLRLDGSVRAAAEQGRRLWLSPRGEDRLFFEFRQSPGAKQVEGLLSYELALTGDGAPSRDVPFSVAVANSPQGPGAAAEVFIEARKRARFMAPAVEGDRLYVILTPRDPAVLSGLYLEGCRIVTSREHPGFGALWLALQGLAGAALCMALVMFVRSWSTAPTAALAGVLLFSALTLLPGFEGGQQMWRDRRRAVENQEVRDSGFQTAMKLLSSLPPLCPPDNFEAHIGGRVVEAGLADVAWRALAALALMPLGAVLFSRRQIT